LGNALSDSIFALTNSAGLLQIDVDATTSQLDWQNMEEVASKDSWCNN
jgi:hypothetical protein